MIIKTGDKQDLCILSIELENFKSFSGSCKIPFDNQLNIITGEKGTGKSNIINAINFVFSEDEPENLENYITTDKNYAKVSAEVITSNFDNKRLNSFKIIKEIMKISGSYKCLTSYKSDNDISDSECKTLADLFYIIGTRLIDCPQYHNMDETLEKAISGTSKNTQLIVVSNKNISTADETITVKKDENGCSIVDVRNVDYYTKYFREWAFLRKISVETALNMIKQQPEAKIKEFVDLTHAEIAVMLEKYKIKPNEFLACDFKDGNRIEEREIEFFNLIKRGYEAREIAHELMVSPFVVQTNVKKILAKILLHLYPILKEDVLQIKKYE